MPIRPPRDDIDRLSNIVDAMCDDIMNMSDEEIAAEMAEEGITSAELSEIFDRALAKAIRIVHGGELAQGIEARRVETSDHASRPVTVKE